MLASVKIADSVQQGLDGLLGFIPNILGFLAILLIGYLIARVVKGIVAKLLERVGLDRTLHESDAGRYVERVSPFRDLGTLVPVRARALSSGPDDRPPPSPGDAG